MKNHLLSTMAVCVFCQINYAQNIQFEQVRPLPPAPQNIADFDGVDRSSIAFADVDRDNDPDVLITGYSNSESIAKLYENDGIGNYTEVTGTPFDGVRFSSIAFADVDMDNDPDVLITGENSSGQYVAKLYQNDGTGHFTEVTGTPFEGVRYSSIAFADVDGDNDPDVLITGENNFDQRIAILYQNDGTGNFTKVTGTSFDGVDRSFIAFADVDKDNDQDILITGRNNFNQRTAKLYENDGIGNYTEVTDMPFDGVEHSSIAFADVDKDNDLDVFITGRKGLSGGIAKLYENDGNGNFTEVVNTPFEGVRYSSIAFADVDNDSDQDVLITGAQDSGPFIAKLYENDGTGNFTEVTDTPFDGVYFSSIAFADVDKDNDQDVLITGENFIIQSIAKLYQNDGTGDFTEVTGSPFDGVSRSSIAFADVDKDNDLDVLIVGYNHNNPYKYIAKLYQNDGVGNYTEVIDTPFDGVRYASIAFSDVDNDQDQDVLITGRKNSDQPIAKLYENDGSGIFTEVTDTPFDGVYNSSIAFSDVDNDNDQDVLITGRNNSNQRIAKLYANDGTGHFTEVTGTPFDGVEHSSIAFADIDKDNDQDVLITGENNFRQRIAILYENDGFGNFTEVINTPFDGVNESSIAFSDVDNDNDPDVLITGHVALNGPIAKLYENDGFGNFNEVAGTPFVGVYLSSLAFADVDKDNDLDVLMTGENSSGQQTAKLYQNDGNRSFTEVIDTPFEGVYLSSVVFADIDKDNAPDVLIAGRNKFHEPITKLYRNVTDTETGIRMIENGKAVFAVAYPNPTSANVNIEMRDRLISGKERVEVSNVMGKVVYQNTISTQQFVIDLSNNKGVYFIHIITEKETNTLKVIKE